MSTQSRHNPSVREAFVREIENKILSGELKPGDRLPTSRELCARMGVSLTIVNAGVAELVNKGFVEVKPRHGVYVADYKAKGNPAMLLAIIQHNGGRLNAHDVRSFCETRLALDPLVAELSVQRAGDEEIAEWEGILRQLREEEDVENFCVLITEFFHKLYRISDNSILAMLFHCTMEPQQRMYQFFLEKNGKDLVLQNAEDIFRFIRSRDSAGAVQCLKEAMRLPLEGDTAIV